MARIRTYNNIAAEGVEVLTSRGHEVGPRIEDPDGILVRSADLHELEFGPSLLAIARAGAGVNNIPLARCGTEGVAVFNTPGSNANGVKELVVAGLLLSSRRIIEGVHWSASLNDSPEEIGPAVERGKSQFAGPELAGKRLGVVGLGAIGVMVANAGVALDMEVSGVDPFISVESAWGLSRAVNRAESVEALIGECDYLTIHVPLNAQTRGFIDSQFISRMKQGVRLLNFARGPLVDEKAVISALKEEKIARYVTDFPSHALLHAPNVITIPHLGASTPEAERNSAVMAARELADYLEEGTVTNAVNLPACRLERNGGDRLIFGNRNVPNMVGQVTSLLAAHNCKHRKHDQSPSR